MAVDINKFLGKWVVNRLDSRNDERGINLGDSLEISLAAGENSANLVLNGKIFPAELREEGLCSDLMSDDHGPMALQISVFHQLEPGMPNYYRALYGTAIKKDPDNVGVWGAEEDDSGKVNT